MNPARFGGKSILATGGSSGSGFASSTGLISESAALVISGRNQGTLDRALRDLGLRVHAISVDVSRFPENQTIKSLAAIRKARGNDRSRRLPPSSDASYAAGTELGIDGGQPTFEKENQQQSQSPRTKPRHE